jgi:hypothetical protein
VKRDDRTQGKGADAPDTDTGKRHAKRVRRRLMVKFGANAADKTGFTKNVSVTGLFIHTNTIFKPGTTLQVTVHFPDRTFSHWARVVWGKQVPPQLAHVVECGMGVSFIDPDAAWVEFVEAWKAKLGAS